jgi:hypothetical protein
MIGESTDFTSQAIAFGYLGLAFGVGTVLGACTSLKGSPTISSQKAGLSHQLLQRPRSVHLADIAGVMPQVRSWEEPSPCPVRI